MPDNGIGGLEIGASMECAYCRNGVYRRIDMVNPRIRSAISIFNGDYCDVYNLLYDDSMWTVFAVRRHPYRNASALTALKMRFPRNRGRRGG